MRALRVPAVVVMTVVLSMGLLLVGAGPAAAAICTVPGTHGSIQMAVNDLSCATINVSPGTYTENVVIFRGLTLNGPNAGTSGNGARGPEATVDQINITASSVIVDGFSFTNPGIQMNIFGATVLSGVIVKNNIFSGYGIVGFPTFNAGDLLVTRNLFENPVPGSEAMQIKAPAGTPGCSGTVVSDNVFTAASDNGSADINFSCTGSGSTGVTVSGNTDTGLTLGTSFTAFSGVVDGIVVTDNDVTGTATAGSAIFFWGGVTGSVDINNNVVTGFGGDGIAVRNFLEGNHTGSFSFTYNDLSANRRSISLGNAFDPGASVTANRNNVSGNSTTVGFQNDSISLVADAICNWWGSATGPFDPPDNLGSGNAAVGEMDYTPWLTTPDLNGPCFGGLPPGKVVGGGQIAIAVTGGKGTFGFNAKLKDGVSGHLNYENHVTKIHLNCTVTMFEVLTSDMAKFSGPCDQKDNSFDNFIAEVQDNGKPKDGTDTFKITYCTGTTGCMTDNPSNAPITSGNITIKLDPDPAAAESAHGTTAAGASSIPSGATFNGVSLSSMQLGTGLSIGSGGTAAGEFLAVLIGTSPLGQRQEIGVQGVVVSGSIGPAGTATFGGSATVSMGSGSVTLLNVPFTVTATAQSVLLNLGTSTLPSATLTEGSVTIY